ncbi:Flp1 family type IVb pilin [Helicovermis profundi]|uniref:Putative Flagellin Flp1-like domain-containing protein n=1 Tax=Helicovermis profundi TaxID=3065157 RepID=A0AAU9EA09_9FIRM|nr:hypothetical protein HLPR_19480 [Clostridia bacterium S502]
MKINNNDGMGTIEIVFIIAILIGLALFFGSFVMKYTKNQVDKINETNLQIEKVEYNDN